MRRSGNLPRALDLYSEGLALYPNDRVLVRGYAAALNEADRPADTLALVDEFGRSSMIRLRAVPAAWPMRIRGSGE